MNEQKNESTNLITVRGELALLLIVIMNSFGVVLMLYSGSGISAISSVPYAFSEVLLMFMKHGFKFCRRPLHSEFCTL